MRENGIFFTPVKYTLACRAPQVSWAARHTTVCLDIKNKIKGSRDVSDKKLWNKFLVAIANGITT